MIRVKRISFIKADQMKDDQSEIDSFIKSMLNTFIVESFSTCSLYNIDKTNC